MRKYNGVALGETRVLVKQDGTNVLRVVLDRQGAYQKYYAFTALGPVEISLGKVSNETASVLSKAVDMGLSKDISLGSTIEYEREVDCYYER